MQVTYIPERPPLLSDWYVPVHQYIKYCRPDFSNEDVKTFLSCLKRGVPYPFELVRPEPDDSKKDVPISNKKVNYCQSMFQNFQIQYITFEGNPHYSPSLFEYMGFQDEFISGDIKRRDEFIITAYWKSVFESVEDILYRIFKYSEDFVSIIKEEKLSDKEFIYQEYLEKYPNQKIDGLTAWLELFHQQNLLEKEKNTFSALLTQDDVIRHYLIQWSGTNIVYKDMMGSDYITEQSTRQLAFITIPFIGDFISVLKENAELIADAAKRVMSLSDFHNHFHKIKNYLSNADLDNAVIQWNETYKIWKKHHADLQHLMTKPDDDFLGLRRYEEKYGNLFQNLKDVLELYCSCLSENANL